MSIGLEQALKVMENWQHWRRCNNEECDCEPIDPVIIGAALDYFLEYAKQDLENDL